MKAQPVSNSGFPYAQASSANEASSSDAESFRAALDAQRPLSSPAAPAPAGSQPGIQSSLIMPSTLMLSQPLPSVSRQSAAAAYSRQATQPGAPQKMSGWQKYKDDQLLRNPGGSNYYFEKDKVVVKSDKKESFMSRMGKDLSDVAGNLKNLVGNFLMGSKIHYRDQNNQIKVGEQRGLIGTFGDMFKNLGSALTFGLWHPGSQKAPHGIKERLSCFGSGLKKALLGDLVEGIPQSLNHMGKNIILTGWNLTKVVPDATIGNLSAGKKLSNKIFDNGQVMVEYLTDVIPTGDAWLRVHAASLKGLKPPVLYNLKMPEHSTGDTRWEYVRNTPFRKSIETIGALLADAATFALAGQTGISGNEHNEKKELVKALSQGRKLFKK